MIGYSSAGEPRTKRPHTFLQTNKYTTVDSQKYISRLLPSLIKDACYGRGVPLIFVGSSLEELYTFHKK